MCPEDCAINVSRRLSNPTSCFRSCDKSCLSLLSYTKDTVYRIPILHSGQMLIFHSFPVFRFLLGIAAKKQHIDDRQLHVRFSWRGERFSTKLQSHLQGNPHLRTFTIFHLQSAFSTFRLLGILSVAIS